MARWRLKQQTQLKRQQRSAFCIKRSTEQRGVQGCEVRGDGQRKEESVTSQLYIQLLCQPQQQFCASRKSEEFSADRLFSHFSLLHIQTRGCVRQAPKARVFFLCPMMGLPRSWQHFELPRGESDHPQYLFSFHTLSLRCPSRFTSLDLSRHSATIFDNSVSSRQLQFSFLLPHCDQPSLAPS
jgi:hypothetical protein